MKQHQRLGRLAALLLLFLWVFAACGAPEGQETLDDGELTLSYLKNEYTSQLLTDGAEHLVGSVELSIGDDGSPQIILHPKEAAAEANDDGTYTVSSYAINRILSVSDSLYATVKGSDQILSSTDFLTAVQTDYDNDGRIFDEYGDYILYDVYALEDQALLILYNPQYIMPSLDAQ